MQPGPFQGRNLSSPQALIHHSSMLPFRPPSTHMSVERAWFMASRWSAPLAETCVGGHGGHLEPTYGVPHLDSGTSASGRVVDQWRDLLLSCGRLSSLVTERPSTAQRRPGGSGLKDQRAYGAASTIVRPWTGPYPSLSPSPSWRWGQPLSGTIEGFGAASISLG